METTLEIAETNVDHFLITTYEDQLLLVFLDRWGKYPLDEKLT